jgi:hypothetical protein
MNSRTDPALACPSSSFPRLRRHCLYHLQLCRAVTVRSFLFRLSLQHVTGNSIDGPDRFYRNRPDVLAQSRSAGNGVAMENQGGPPPNNNNGNGPPQGWGAQQPGKAPDRMQYA